MFRRFLAYGVAGWGLEVLFNGLAGLRALPNRKLRAQTYLWMLPIYGSGGLALERLHQILTARGSPRWRRALAYMLGIYCIEYASAELLYRVGIGVPWKYERGLHLRGYVRLDYAPFWYGCGLLFEPLAAEIGKLSRRARTAPRARIQLVREAA
jgi:hypothetical protein